MGAQPTDMSGTTVSFEAVMRPEDVIDEYITPVEVNYFSIFESLWKSAKKKLLAQAQLEELSTNLSTLIEKEDRPLILADHYRKEEAKKKAIMEVRATRKLERKRLQEEFAAQREAERLRREQEALQDGLGDGAGKEIKESPVPLTLQSSLASAEVEESISVADPTPSIRSVLSDLRQHLEEHDDQYQSKQRATAFRLALSRALIQQLLGSVEEVLEVCTKNLETNPLSVLATKHAAFAYEELGNLKEALNMFQRWLTLTEIPEIHGRIGDILYVKRQYARAFHHFRMAVALEPRSEVSLRRLENARRFYIARLVRTTLREEDLLQFEPAPPRISQAEYQLPPASRALQEFFQRWKSEEPGVVPVHASTSGSNTLISRTRKRKMARSQPPERRRQSSLDDLTRTELRLVTAENMTFSQRAEAALPALPVRPENAFDVCSFHYVSSSDPSEDIKSYSAVCSGQRVSLYPWLPGHTAREGGPITDVFGITVFPNLIVSALADGSSWGHTARHAATKSVQGFLAEISRLRGELTNTERVPQLLLQALAEAHNNILRSNDSDTGSEVGTTAFLGGVLLPLKKKPGQWMYICASVGNCKAFCISSQQVVEITAGNDDREEGGFLGVMDANSVPEFKPFQLFWHHCQDGDIITLASDGVHDNFNPKYLGIAPRDLKLPIEEWGEAKPVEVNQAVAPFIVNSIDDKIHRSGIVPSPHRCSFSLLSNALDTTQKSRNFMEQNPTKKLPDDYSLFPGQLDFATCLSFLVGSFSEQHARAPDLWDYHCGMEESLSTSLTKPPCSHPLAENSPISYMVSEHKGGVVILCRTLARGNLRCIADDTQVYLKLYRSRANLMKLEQLTAGFTPVPDECEVHVAAERTVQLPAHIEPSTQTIKQDSSGLYCIRFEYKK